MLKPYIYSVYKWSKMNVNSDLVYGESMENVWAALKMIQDRDELDPRLPQLLFEIYLRQESDNEDTAFMCCVAELARLWDPMFPYSNPQIIEIILKACLTHILMLNSPEEADFERHCYIVKWMSRSNNLFTACLQLKNYKYKFLKILETAFEGSSWSSENVEDLLELALRVVDISSQPYLPDKMLLLVLDRFSRQGLESLPSQQYSFACRLIAKRPHTFKPSLYEITSDYLSYGIGRPVLSRFYKSLYEILFNIFIENPETVIDIIPLVEKELTSDKAPKRLKAVSFLGILFSQQTRETFKYRSLWEKFLERFLDIRKSIAIRCVEVSLALMKTHHELTNDIMEVLGKVHDNSSSELRFKVICCLEELVEDEEILIAAHPIFWNILNERINDSVDVIQYCTLYAMSKVYMKLVDVTILQEEIIMNIKNAANKILQCYLSKDIEKKCLVEKLLQKYLVPISLEINQRMKRLLKLLLDSSRIAFNAFIALQTDQRRLSITMLTTVKTLKSDTSETTLNSLSQNISQYFPNKIDVTSGLREFLACLSDNNKILLAIQYIVDPLTSISDRNKMFLELIEHFKLQECPQIVIFLKLFHKRLSFIIDEESLKVFVMTMESVFHEKSTSDDEQNPIIQRCMEFLKIVVLSFPEFFLKAETLSYLASFVQRRSPVILSAITSLSKHSIVEEIFIDIAEQHDLLEQCDSFLRTGSAKLVKETVKMLCTYFSSNEIVMRKIYQTMEENNSSESITNQMRGLVASGLTIICLKPYLAKQMELINKFRENVFVDEENTGLEHIRSLSDHEITDLILLKVEMVKVFSKLLVCLDDSNHAFENLINLIRQRDRLLPSAIFSESGKILVYHSVAYAVFKVTSAYQLNIYNQYTQSFLDFVSFLILTGHNESTKLLLNKLLKYLLRELPLKFIGSFCFVPLKNNSQLTEFAHSVFSHLINERRSRCKSKEPSDNEEVERAVLGALFNLSERLVSADLQEEQFSSCVNFALTGLMKSEIRHLDLYVYLIDRMSHDLKMDPQVTYELRKMVSAHLRCMKRN